MQRILLFLEVLNKLSFSIQTFPRQNCDKEESLQTYSYYALSRLNYSLKKLAQAALHHALIISKVLFGKLQNSALQF